VKREESVLDNVTSCSFGMPDPHLPAGLEPALADLFPGRRTGEGEERFVVLDSFDWRFYAKGLLVRKAGGELVLENLAGGRVLNRVAWDGGDGPVFADRIAESGFAVRARRVLAVRALLPLGTVSRRWRRWDLLNGDEKTVVRLVHESYALDGGGDEPARCRVVPLKGYGKAARRLAGALRDLGLVEEAEHPVVSALRGAGLEPGGYSSRVAVDLPPELATAEAVQLILARLVGVMRANLPGIRDDVDTEFLHDFRVAVRRARSLLAQLKDVFDAEPTARLRNDLKAVGAVTSPLRDLDVYLLREKDYVALVPPFLKPGVAQLFRNLKRRRKRAYGKLVAALDDPSFAAALAGLDRFAQSTLGPADEGGAGRVPVLDAARAAIRRRYRKIIRHGGRIGPDTPDAALHALRLECKKLRYLLEFFAPLFPAKDMARLIAQLKRLQDHLGELNDLNVQQSFLLDQLLERGDDEGPAPLTSGATGGLITQLEAARREVRGEFLEVFAAFGSSANRKRFRKLFGRRGPG